MWDYDFFGGWQYIFKKVRYVFITLILIILAIGYGLGQIFQAKMTTTPPQS